MYRAKYTPKRQPIRPEMKRPRQPGGVSSVETFAPSVSSVSPHISDDVRHKQCYTGQQNKADESDDQPKVRQLLLRHVRAQGQEPNQRLHNRIKHGLNLLDRRATVFV